MPDQRDLGASFDKTVYQELAVGILRISLEHVMANSLCRW